MKKVEEKIKAYSVLTEVFNVLSVVSIHRYRKFKNEVIPLFPYFERLREVMFHLFKLYPFHPFFRVRKENKVEVVVFGSDISFTGKLCRPLTKTLKGIKNARKVYFFGGKCLNRYILENFNVEIVSDVFKKKPNYEKALKVFSKLFREYLLGKVDGIYLVYAKPYLGKVEFEYAEEEKPEEEREIKREILYEKRGKALGIYELLERGGFKIEVLKLLPVILKRKVLKGHILNIEGDKEKLIEEVIKLYTEFYIKFLMLEHFTSLNLIRHRTAKTAQDNLRKEIEKLKNLQRKFRQEKINRELQDLIASVIAFEERVYKDISAMEKAILEIGELNKDIKRVVLKSVKEKFEISEVREVEGLHGFRIITKNKVYDFSIEHYLEQFLKSFTSKEDLSLQVRFPLFP